MGARRAPSFRNLGTQSNFWVHRAPANFEPWFQDFFLQPIMNDWSNMNEYTIGIHMHHIRRCWNLLSWTMGFNPLEI